MAVVQRAGLPLRTGTLLAAALLAGGCATFSKDGGFDSVRQAVKDHTGRDVQVARTPGDTDAIAARVAQLLAQPLGVEEALQVALLNNRALQASFNGLGIAEADVVRAGRLPNPHFSLLRSRAGGDVAVEHAIAFNIFSLLTVPLASQIEKRRFAMMQTEVTMEVLRLAYQTRKAYFIAVAAEESVRYTRQVRTAAEASAELARRMEQVGNWSRLSRAREQGFYADAVLQQARAEKSALSAREQLARLMGVWGKDVAYRLPERLPDLPNAPDHLPDVEALAMERRLDLRMVRQAAEAQAANLGLTRATRFINVLELEVAREREKSHDGEVTVKRSYEIAFELPIFDFGSARLAKAEALYMQTLNGAAHAAINARSEVREAYGGYRASYDIARHYRDEIVPLRKRVAEENLLRYNGMLIGVFELLADARAQILSVNSSIEALRDFWIARSDLDMALIGKASITQLQGASASPAESAAGH